MRLDAVLHHKGVVAACVEQPCHRFSLVRRAVGISSAGQDQHRAARLVSFYWVEIEPGAEIVLYLRPRRRSRPKPDALCSIALFGHISLLIVSCVVLLSMRSACRASGCRAIFARGMIRKPSNSARSSGRACVLIKSRACSKAAWLNCFMSVASVPSWILCRSKRDPI